MKVYIVVKDVGRTYEPYQIIVRVFSSEEMANYYVKNQQYPNKFGIQEWEIDEQ